MKHADADGIIGEVEEILSTPINDNLVPQRLHIRDDAAKLLIEIIAKTSGDYVEIGSFVGGSAILAAGAMEMAGRPGIVFCVDPFTRGETELDTLVLPQWVPSQHQTFWSNIIRAGHQHRVVAFKQYNPPFPEPIYFRWFSVGLIDGNHIFPGPQLDAHTLAKRITDYLLFDNAEYIDVETAIQEMLNTGEWEEYRSVEYKSGRGEEGKTNIFTVLRRIGGTHEVVS